MKRITLFFFILLSFSAFPQDTLRTVVGSFSAGGQVLAGNFKTYSLTFSSDWRIRQRKNDWMLSPQFRYTNNSGALKEREVYSTESYFYRLTPHSKLLVFSEQEHSWLRKTLFRGNLGIGYGYKFVNTKKLEIDISEALLPDFYLSITDIKRDYFAIRPSTRFKLRAEYYPVSFETMNMIQPEIVGWELRGNYRLIDQKNNVYFRSISTLDVSVIKGLSVGGRLDFVFQSYAHTVDPTIRPYDLSFVFYLKYQLRRAKINRA